MDRGAGASDTITIKKVKSPVFNPAGGVIMKAYFISNRVLT